MLLAGACTTTTQTPGAEALVYDLVAYDDEPLPAALEPDGSGFVVSGRLELQPGGVCLREQSVVLGSGPDADEAEETWACTWIRVASNGVELVTLLDGGQEVVSEGLLAGETLELTTPTGIVCVTFPCPSSRSETYTRVR